MSPPTTAAPAESAGRGASARHGTRHYWLCWVGLMLLTILTFALSWIDLGGWAAPVALLIATAKSLLVLFIFMHLLQARASSGFLLAAALLLAVILLALIAADVLTRQVLHTPPVVG